jgi:hypothetical protein
MINRWDLQLRAERKSAKAVRTYLDAAQWFAAGYLIPAAFADWDEVKTRHVQEWIITCLAATPTATPTTSSAHLHYEASLGLSTAVSPWVHSYAVSLTEIGASGRGGPGTDVRAAPSCPGWSGQ